MALNNNIINNYVENIKNQKQLEDFDDSINKLLSKPFKKFVLKKLLAIIPTKKEKFDEWEIVSNNDIKGFVDKTNPIDSWWNQEPISEEWEIIDKDEQLECSYIDDIACQYPTVHKLLITDSPSERVKKFSESCYLILKYFNVI